MPRDARLTVTAMSDSDGRPGAVGGAPTCRTGETDDSRASFSNWASTTTGQPHTIAAPGVCITSTANGGGFATMSGTSMATPHVAGSVALCIGDGQTAGPCAGLLPAQIVDRIRSDAAAHSAVVPGYGFSGDPGTPSPGRVPAGCAARATAATSTSCARDDRSIVILLSAWPICSMTYKVIHELGATTAVRGTPSTDPFQRGQADTSTMRR